MKFGLGYIIILLLVGASMVVHGNIGEGVDLKETLKPKEMDVSEFCGGKFPAVSTETLLQYSEIYHSQGPAALMSAVGDMDICTFPSLFMSEKFSRLGWAVCTTKGLEEACELIKEKIDIYSD